MNNIHFKNQSYPSPTPFRPRPWQNRSTAADTISVRIQIVFHYRLCTFARRNFSKTKIIKTVSRLSNRTCVTRCSWQSSCRILSHSYALPRRPFVGLETFRPVKSNNWWQTKEKKKKKPRVYNMIWILRFEFSRNQSNERVKIEFRHLFLTYEIVHRMNTRLFCRFVTANGMRSEQTRPESATLQHRPDALFA